MNSVETVISHLVSNLAAQGFAFDTDSIDWAYYEGASAVIHERFVVPSTSITPQMRRMLFALGQAWPDPSILALGSFMGYAASWLWAGAASRRPESTSLVGFDTDSGACAQATYNFSAAFGAVDARFVVADATRTCAAPESVGLIYIDIDSPTEGKWGYIRALQAQRSALRLPTLVLAHDAVVPKFVQELDAFNAGLREDDAFLNPIVLPIDSCGLVVSQLTTGRQDQ